MKSIVFALIGCAAVFAGCASVPMPDLYTLDMRSSGQIDPAFSYVAVRIRVADVLARSEIAIKPTPTRVEFYALHSWAGELGQLVSEKLASEFGQKGGESRRAAVNGTLLAFEQVDTATGADVHIKLSVEMEVESSSGPAKQWRQKIYELTLPAEAATPEAVVLALSTGLESIALSIHEDLLALVD